MRIRPSLVFAAGLCLLAAPGFAQCPGAPANLVQNCSFTDVDNESVPTGWDYNFGSFAQNTDDERTAPGALQAVTFENPVEFYQCLGSVGEGSYGFGIHVMSVEQAPRDTQEQPQVAADLNECTISVSTFDGADCSGTETPIPGASATIGTFTPGSYDLVSGSADLLGDIVAVRLRVFCDTGNSESLTLWDDAFFGIGLVPVGLQGFSAE